MKYLSIFLSGVFVLLLASCDLGPKSSYGFTLPEGDSAYGQQYFVEFRCIDCHVVPGLEDELVAPEGIDPIMVVALGGTTTRIATYGELVTSIINPSHKVSREYRLTPVVDEDQSMMRNYNSIMTVDELIDIVAFVQEQYVLQPYTPSRYVIYR